MPLIANVDDSKTATLYQSIDEPGAPTCPPEVGKRFGPEALLGVLVMPPGPSRDGSVLSGLDSCPIDAILTRQRRPVLSSGVICFKIGKPWYRMSFCPRRQSDFFSRRK